MNNPEWRLQPDAVGLYYYCEGPSRWDIPKLAKVRRIETPTETYFEAIFNDVPIRVDSIALDEIMWFGPMPRVTQPSAEFLEKRKKYLGKVDIQP